jgi:hypothetical protein
MDNAPPQCTEPRVWYEYCMLYLSGTQIELIVIQYGEVQSVESVNTLSYLQLSSLLARRRSLWHVSHHL